MASDLKAYFKEVGKTDLLTREEEVELAKRIQAGDNAARDQMIRANIRLAINIAKKYAGKGCDLEDLIQESSLGLIKAVDRFDWRRGFKFSTYACWWIKQAVRQHVASHGSTIKLPSYAKGTLWKMKQFIEKLKPEIELAEQYDSYVALENHGGNILNTMDGLKAFVDNNRSKRLGVAMAPFHLQGAKVSVPGAIKTVSEQLLFFYAWQRGKGVEQLPGHGPADFTPWIAALADINYAWYVNPFMHHEPSPDEMAVALKKSREYLSDCYDKAVPHG